MLTLQQRYQRTASILNRKYILYMIPALLSAVGVSLSEFADTMVVGQLLSERALPIVNLASPIAFMASMVYTITGLGGSLLYAEYLAKKEKERADAFYSASMLFSFAAALVLFLVLLIFRSQLGGLFGCPEELRADFNRYVSYLCWFVLVGVPLMNISYFLPVVGRPFLAMALVVSANVLNVSLDVVLIRFAGMGCEGTALATVIAYLVTLIAGVLICRILKVPLALHRLKNPWPRLREIIRKGFPVGVVQAGYAVTGLFCNRYMNLAFGVTGVVAMSLFSQMDSIISIALSGIGDNNASFAAMLKGEGDYYGIRALTRNVAIGIFLVCSVLAFCFAHFSRPLAGLFNIRGAESLALIARLTPIYVLYYPLRGLLLTLRDLYNTIDRSAYAAALGVMDKVVSVPLVGSVLYLLFGGVGLIAAFPVSMVLILGLVLLINTFVTRRTQGRYSRLLLLDEQDPVKAICSYTVRSLEEAQTLADEVQKSLSEHLTDKELISRICLAVDEICYYIHESCGADTPVDIMICSGPGGTNLICRNPGVPFYPIRTEEKERTPNEQVLTKLFRISHEYIFGLNSTNLTIGGEHETKNRRGRSHLHRV